MGHHIVNHIKSGNVIIIVHAIQTELCTVICYWFKPTIVKLVWVCDQWIATFPS